MEYKKIAFLYEKLESTSKRLEKTYMISEFIKEVKEEDIEAFSLLINGKVFPVWSDKKIGIADRLIIKAISRSTATSEKEIEREWKQKGDLGLVVEEFIKKKKQVSLFPKKLDLNDVFKSFRKLSKITGQGAIDKKLNMLSDLLISSTPSEAKYVARTAIENMRVGIGSGTLRDSIVWAYFGNELNLNYDLKSNKIILDEESRKKYNEYVEKVQKSIDITNDVGEVLRIIRKEGIIGLNKINLVPGRPINVMLYKKAIDVKDAFSIVGSPAAFEYKYDGFRLQIHKSKEGIDLFTRRLERVNDQFPDIIPVLEKSIDANEYILDSEIVGYDPYTKKYLPFQKISQRIRRKYDIEEISKKFPVEINIFDLLFIEGKNYLDVPFKDRRQKLEFVVKQKEREIVLTTMIITDDEKEAALFYDQSVKSGEEGVMAKSLTGIYKPGSRVGYGVKIKPTLDPLDLVVVASEWGEGKRKGWLTSFTLACIDENGDEYLEIGKVSTGFKEIGSDDGTSFAEVTKLLEPLIYETKGKEVKVRPEIVLEVAYEEIQKSINYSSGYALRFPRLLRLRQDKPVDEISRIEDVQYQFNTQRGR